MENITKILIRNAVKTHRTAEKDFRKLREKCKHKHYGLNNICKHPKMEESFLSHCSIKFCPL